LTVAIAQAGGREVYLSEALSWVALNLDIWPNYVFRFNFTEQNERESMAALKQHIAEGKAPNWLILNHTSGQNEWLLKNGFEKKNESTGMAVDLAEVQPDLPALDGLTISTVADNTGLNDWAETVSAGMWRGEVDLERAAFLKLIEQGDIQCYVAYLDQQPVATSMLYLSAGVAGIYLVSTRPEYRKRGIGTIMTLIPLQAARRLGYKVGILQATEAGKPVYERIGFREICTFNYYALPGVLITTLVKLGS
jgi:ribosomal protein S18 acetylase RimI-like enzyme